MVFVVAAWVHAEAQRCTEVDFTSSSAGEDVVNFKTHPYPSKEGISTV
jgi:hypothetical protein